MVTENVPEYPVFIHPDVMSDGSEGWVAEHPDLPGCVAYSTKKSLAEAELVLAREAYLTSLAEDGIDPPLPRDNPPFTVLFREIRPATPDNFESNGIRVRLYPLHGTSAPQLMTA